MGTLEIHVNCLRAAWEEGFALIAQHLNSRQSQNDWPQIVAEPPIAATSLRDCRDRFRKAATAVHTLRPELLPDSVLKAKPWIIHAGVEISEDYELDLYDPILVEIKEGHDWLTLVVEPIHSHAQESRRCFDKLDAAILGIAGIGDRDGPVPPNRFCWNGRVYGEYEHDGTMHRGLTKKAFALVNELWSAKHRTADIEDLKEPVWGDREEKEVKQDTIGSVRKVGNHFFKAHRLPFKISVDWPNVTLREEDSRDS